jgi:hypothetical protein
MVKQVQVTIRGLGYDTGPITVMMYTLSKIGSSAQFRRIHGRNPHCSDFNTNYNPKTYKTRVHQ